MSVRGGARTHRHDRLVAGSELPDQVTGEATEIDVKAWVCTVVGDDFEASLDENVVGEIGVALRVDGEAESAGDRDP